MFACTKEFHRSCRLRASSGFWMILRDACECQADSGGLSHEVDLKETSQHIQSKWKQFMAYERCLVLKIVYLPDAAALKVIQKRTVIILFLYD